MAMVTIVSVRLSAAEVKQLDDYRRKQTKIPSQAGLVHELPFFALEELKKGERASQKKEERVAA